MEGSGAFTVPQGYYSGTYTLSVAVQVDGSPVAGMSAYGDVYCSLGSDTAQAILSADIVIQETSNGGGPTKLTDVLENTGVQTCSPTNLGPGGFSSGYYQTNDQWKSLDFSTSLTSGASYSFTFEFSCYASVTVTGDSTNDFASAACNSGPQQVNFGALSVS